MLLKEAAIDLDLSQFRNYKTWRFVGFEQNTIKYENSFDSKTALEFQFYPKTDTELLITFNVLLYGTKHLTVHFLRVQLRPNDTVEDFVNAVIRWVSDGGGRDFIIDFGDFVHDPYSMVFTGFNYDPNGTGISDLIRSGVKFKNQLTSMAKSRAASVR